MALVLDLCSRGMVGSAISDRMTAGLTLTLLKLALQRRQPEAGVIVHSDRASQYTDHAYQALFEADGIRASTNSVGSWCHNAPTETFIGTLETEVVYPRRYRTRDEPSADLFFYIEAFYNRRRPQSSPGYLSPAACEQLYYQQCGFRLISLSTRLAKDHVDNSHTKGYGRAIPRSPVAHTYLAILLSEPSLP